MKITSIFKSSALNLSVFISTLAMIVTLGSSPSAKAQSSLAISPTLVEFEGRTRFATLTLINRGNKSKNYRISFINQRMLENGDFELIKQPVGDEGFASPYLRYSPRQIKLEPGKPQTVRVMLRMPGNTPDGEYRSHLRFQEMPEIGSAQKVNTGSDSLSVRVNSSYGIAIPIFIRKGILESSAALSNIKVEKTDNSNSRIHFEMTRSGTKSTRGNINILAGDELIGEMKGVPLYLSTNKRHLSFPIETHKIKGRKIKIEYVARDKDGGKIIASLSN